MRMVATVLHLSVIITHAVMQKVILFDFIFFLRAVSMILVFKYSFWSDLGFLRYHC